MRPQNNQYKYSDEQGSYTVCFGDRTLEIKFIGILSDQLVEKFCEDLGLMLGVVEWRYWGYYADLTECDEESATSRKTLVDLRKRFLDKGCIVDAYTITNPDAVENLIKSSKDAGVENYLLDENIFPDRKQAIDFIHSVLLKVEKSSAKVLL